MTFGRAYGSSPGLRCDKPRFQLVTFFEGAGNPLLAICLFVAMAQMGEAVFSRPNCATLPRRVGTNVESQRDTHSYLLGIAVLSKGAR